MKVKVSELTRCALDWAVAKAEGIPGADIRYFKNTGSLVRLYNGGPTGMCLDYSTNWSQGGPIIERERIDLCWSISRIQCMAQVAGCAYTGPTPLIAAMRCFVASKLGDEVGLPEELLL